MSKYTLEYLSTHTLVGDVSRNGLPWTARALGLTDADVDTADWLFAGSIPVNQVTALLDSYAVESYPVGFLREFREGDKEAGHTVFQPAPGKPRMTWVTDDNRQIIADSTRDTVHGVFKDGYQIHPFTETLVDRTARIVSESRGDLHVDSVGVLADGAEGWVSISAGDLLTLPEGVDFYPHILASSSCNGTLATTVQAVNTMTVCDNTRAMALGEGRKNGTVTRQRHSKMSAERLARGENEAAAAMGLIQVAAEDFAAAVSAQVQMSVSDAQWSEFIVSLSPLKEDAKPAAVTRAENFRDAVTTLWNSDERVNPWKGTAFGALQAVSTFDLWERQAYGTTDHYARNMRETLTGKVDERETERAAALMRVLTA